MNQSNQYQLASITGVKTMRALSICMGLILSLGLLVGESNANITMFKENTQAVTINNSGPVARTVEFFSSDFGDHPTANIISIDVEVTFRKLAVPGNSPFYNQIRMVLQKGAVNTTLINNNNAIGGGADSFATGFLGDAGFNGMVRFSSFDGVNPSFSNEPAGPTRTNVNANQFVIPNSNVTGAAYRPAGSTARWSAFDNQSAIGVFTLNLSDINAPGDSLNDPLDFVSMRVTITAVPEPSSFGLCGLLTLGGAFIRRRVRG